jgi:hypothetical protein
MLTQADRAHNRILQVIVAVLSFLFAGCHGEPYASSSKADALAARPNVQEKPAAIGMPEKSAASAVSESPSPADKQMGVPTDTAERMKAKREEQFAAFKRGPKRQPTDPIYVSLVQPVLDGKMQQVEKSKGAVSDQLRSEFVSHPVITLVNPALSGKTVHAGIAQSIADVEVAPKVWVRESRGVAVETGKPVKLMEVVYEATITSQVSPDVYTVSELGKGLADAEASKRFARQVKRVILEKIGPTIPAH